MNAEPASRSGVLSIALSLLLHAVLVAGGAWLLARSLSGADDGAHMVTLPAELEILADSPGIELPRMSHAGLSGAPDREAEPREQLVVGGGGERMPRPDQLRAGRGGSELGARALNLADSDDGLTLDRDPINRLDRSQIQRLDTADERRSRDDRRATPNPMELSFLATGRGELAERRPSARWNPSRGVLHGDIAQSEGSELGGPETEPGVGPEALPGGDSPGAERDRTGAGVVTSAHDRDHRRSAAVMLARPMVKQGRAAVPAPERGRPNDNVDSTQEVASAVQSLIHASTAGGLRGTGPGGEPAPGAVGSGGQDGPGAKSQSNGYGRGNIRSGTDPRLSGYFRGIVAKVEPYWRNAFPDWALAEGRSGVATIAFSIRTDGSVGSLRVARGSGVPEFDANVMAAIRRAAPFEPPPAIVGKMPLELTITFDALNPAIGREGPGRGRRR